jgi:hypothetical protein
VGVGGEAIHYYEKPRHLFGLESLIKAVRPDSEFRNGILNALLVKKTLALLGKEL